MALYNKYSDDLRKRYGQKVYKLPVNLPVSCPNRDGTCGDEGCVFCGDTGAGFETLSSCLPVEEQINTNRAYIAPKYKAEKFIVYFQNFSNTYLSPNKLREYASQACSNDVVGLAIATRPDCIHEQHLQVLQEIQTAYGVDITLELGLQTVNYHTLQVIRRGHTLAEFIDATLRIKKHHMGVCAHLILSLPWDDMLDVTETAKIVSALGIDQVKLHALYIVKDTVLAGWYESGTIQLISKEEYVERVVNFLAYLDPGIVVQRLIGRAPKNDTLFVNWQTSWWKIQEAIERRMTELGLVQGSKFGYLNGSSVRQFL